MRAGEILAGLFWLALAAGATYVGWALGLGTLRDPGPGFLLFGIGLIMVGLSAGVVAAAARAPAPSPGTPGPWAATRWPKVALVIAALLVYAWAFERLGFILSTILLMIFLFKAVEPQRWWVAVGGGVVTALLAYLVFGLWLRAQLPKGIFFD